MMELTPAEVQLITEHRARNAEIEKLHEKVRRLQKERDDVVAEASVATEAHRKTLDEFHYLSSEDARNVATIANLRSEIRDIHAERAAILDKNAELVNEIAKLRAEVDELRKRNTEMKITTKGYNVILNELDEARRDCARETATIVDLRGEINEMSELTVFLQRRNDDLVAEVKKLVDEFARHRSQDDEKERIQQLETQLQERIAECEKTKALNADLEELVRSLLP